MAVPLSEYFSVITSDIHDYGWPGQQQVRDFLINYPEDFDPDNQPDWVVANPPFRLAVEFIEKGLLIARRGVAVLVRVAFGEGVERFERLYRDNPPTIIAFYVERVPMVRGRYDPDAASATAYCWMVWKRNARSAPPVWIPPCRRSMERPTDIELVQWLPADPSDQDEAPLFDVEASPVPREVKP